MSTAHHPSTHQDVRLNVARSRLTFNEQLCLFGPVNEARAPEASVRPWAWLALVLAVLPWVLVGLMVWMLAY